MNFLIGGLVGGIIAALFSALYTYRMHQVRRRSDVTLEVVSWADDVYDRLVTIYAQREAVFTGKPFGLTNDEYRSTVKEAKAMLLSSKMHTRVALVYGKGPELKMFDALRNEFIALTEILLAAEKDTWEAANKELNHRFADKAEPLKEAVEKAFLSSATVVSVTRDFVKDNIPTLYLPVRGDKDKGVLIYKDGQAEKSPRNTGEFIHEQAVRFAETLLAIIRVLAGCVLVGVFVWVCAGMPNPKALVQYILQMPQPASSITEKKEAAQVESRIAMHYAEEGGFGSVCTFSDRAMLEAYQKTSAGNPAQNVKPKK